MNLNVSCVRALATLVLCYNIVSYGSVAYIPTPLKQCLADTYKLVKDSNNTINLHELYCAINENRSLVSDTIMRRAINELLSALDKDNSVGKRSQAVQHYLKEYYNALKNRSILLAIEGNQNYRESFPISLISASPDISELNKDIMHLSSELTFVKNIEVCGNVDISLQSDLSEVKQQRGTHVSVPFNPNMLTSTGSAVTFGGTGVSSPMINAWAMAPSGSAQVPVTMQLALPKDFKQGEPVCVELHFLVTNQSNPAGNVRINVNAEYIKQGGEFDILNYAPDFTNDSDSDNFLITEPTSDANVKHVWVRVILDKSHMKKQRFAILSLTRMAPTSGSEYAGDIYLAAAVFRYTSKNC